MYYKVDLRDHIRLPPKIFHLPLEEAIIQRIKKKYDGYISKDFGIVLDVLDLNNVQEGVIIPNDGAAYYKTEFTLLTFKPELQEVLFGKIKDIADFGAFMTIGPMEGMIHISQTMDDFVSFSKDKVLIGKETKRTLKVNDLCKARIIAVSFKDIENPKIGLTMRQIGLGKIDWLVEEKKKEEKEEPEKKTVEKKAGEKKK